MVEEDNQENKTKNQMRTKEWLEVQLWKAYVFGSLNDRHNFERWAEETVYGR